MKLVSRKLGLKAAVSKLLGATWQRCRVRFYALAPVGKSGRRVVSVFVATRVRQGTAPGPPGL